MMQSWKREHCGPGRIGGSRGRPEDDLEFSKMDTLIMQMSRVSRAVAEINESCLGLEESISKEEKNQAELESELKASSALNPLRSQQHSLTKSNLQASIQVTKDHIEIEERENSRLEQEIETLVKRMKKVKEMERTKLNKIKDHYGSQLLDKEKIEQQKRVLELRDRKNKLITCIMKLKQEKQGKIHREWKAFVETIVKMARLQQMIRYECKSLQQYKVSVQILQTTIKSMKQVDSSPSISREHIEHTNQVMRHSSPFFLHAKQPDLTNPRTTNGGASNVSTSTYPPLSRSSFTTSLSFLKLTHMKTGEQKMDNSSRSTQDVSEGTVEPSFAEEQAPQNTIPLRSSQPQHQEAIPESYSNNGPQIAEFNKITHFSLVNNQHHQNETTMWNQTAGDISARDVQGTTKCSEKTISFSPAVHSAANTQPFESYTQRPRDMNCSTLIPQPERPSSTPTKTSSKSPKAFGGVGMTPLRIPLSRSRRLGTAASRGLGASPFRFAGFGSQCLLSKYAGVPASSRGGGIPSVLPKSFGICSPTHSQKPHQKYSEPYIDNTELSRLSLSIKPVTCKEALQEFHPSTNHSEETLCRKDASGHSIFSKVSTSTAVTTTDGLSGPLSSTLPSNQGETISSSYMPVPMEVDDNESSENEETPLPTSQEFRMTEGSTTNEAELQGSSPEVTQQLQSCNKSGNEICSPFMGSSNTKDTTHSSEHSQEISSAITSTPEKSVDNRQVTDCVPPASLSSLSTSVPMSHSNNEPNKIQFQSRPPSIKSLQYKQSPVTSDIKSHTSQEISSNSPVEDSSFPFMFQKGLQASTERNQPFNLFGSPPIAESPSQTSGQNSGSSLFMFENSSNLREDNTNTGLFNFNLGSDGESAEHSGSGFLSSLFDSSSGTNSSSDENTGFRLF